MKIFTDKFAKIIKEIFELGHKDIKIHLYPDGTYILSTEQTLNSKNQ